MATTPYHLLAVASEFGAALVGLVVSHRGRTMTLTGHPGQWEAVALAEPDGVEEHDVYGYGDTVPAALDACARMRPISWRLATTSTAPRRTSRWTPPTTTPGSTAARGGRTRSAKCSSSSECTESFRQHFRRILSTAKIAPI